MRDSTSTGFCKPETLVFKAEWIKAVVADPHVGDKAKAVAAALAFRFHNSTTGECFPSNRKLALAVGGGQHQTVQRPLRQLQDRGWIEWKSGNGAAHRASEYRLTMRSDVEVEASPLSQDVAPPVTGYDTPLQYPETTPVSGCIPQHMNSSREDELMKVDVVDSPPGSLLHPERMNAVVDRPQGDLLQRHTHDDELPAPANGNASPIVFGRKGWNVSLTDLEALQIEFPEIEDRLLNYVPEGCRHRQDGLLASISDAVARKPPAERMAKARDLLEVHRQQRCAEIRRKVVA